MKIGPLPIHIISDRGFTGLREHIHNLQIVGDTVERLRMEIKCRTEAGFMHPSLIVPTGAPFVLNADSPSQASLHAVDRIIEAYRRAMESITEIPEDYWHEVRLRHGAFVDALCDGNRDYLDKNLRRFFQSDLVWGLGRVHPDHVDDIRHGAASYILRRITDALVSLAESLGVVRVACCEQQGIEACDYSLDVDLAALLDEVETRSKMQFSVPAIGAPFGAVIGGRRIMLDALLHGWTVTRAEQLLESDAARIVEIGGGYGCLARMLYQAGRRDVAIVDLPWVNAIQGYYLLMTLPEGSVSLFGEGAASVQVLPHWCFRQYDQRSIDLVINTNSLPEMSRTTAAAYIEDISRVVRGVFLSVNQESTRHIPATAAQQWVAQLINEHGGYKTVSRSRWWMAEGYVEEVFRPIGKRHHVAVDGDRLDVSLCNYKPALLPSRRLVA